MLPPGGGGSPLTPAIWKAETGRTCGSLEFKASVVYRVVGQALKLQRNKQKQCCSHMKMLFLKDKAGGKK